MFAPRSVKLEKRIKDLNALMAEYRNEMEEADKRFHNREINEEKKDRIHRRGQSKISSISEKIRGCRAELDLLK